MKLASHSRLCIRRLLQSSGPVALSYADGKVEGSCIKFVELVLN